MKHIAGTDSLEAWRGASNHILQPASDVFNLFVEIENPCRIDLHWLEDHNPADHSTKSISYDNIIDVANTIFPSKLAQRCANREELYVKYLQRHLRKAKLAAKKRNMWGTYFQRLVAFENQAVLRDIFSGCSSFGSYLRVYRSNVVHLNQVERVICALRDWTTGSSAALNIHLSSFDFRIQN